MSALANTAVVVLIVLGILIDVVLLAQDGFGSDVGSIWETNEPYLAIAILVAVVLAPFAAGRVIGTAAAIAAVAAVIAAIVLAGTGIYRRGRGRDRGDASFSYGP